MSKRPEKKECIRINFGVDFGETMDKVIGYNQAIEEYENFLPSEDELKEIIHNKTIIELFDYPKELAKAIHKRLRGES